MGNKSKAESRKRKAVRELEPASTHTTSVDSLLFAKGDGNAPHVEDLSGGFSTPIPER